MICWWTLSHFYEKKSNEADDQDALEKNAKQNEEAVKVTTSGNTIDVGGCEVDVDGKSLNEDNLEKIIGELINQDVKLVYKDF